MAVRMRYITIDLRDQTIAVLDDEGTYVKFLSRDDTKYLKFAKVSAGGHIIQALVRMLEDAHYRSSSGRRGL
jgi:hypothetical protein